MAVNEEYFSQERKSISSAESDSEKNSPRGCFDCNICLDFANDPVVTLCGHLYCWPCIYKWFHFQSPSQALVDHPQCPVCKSEISQTTVVPLYGRGQTPTEIELEDKAPFPSISIPPRPPASSGTRILNPSPCHPGPYDNQQFPPEPLQNSEGEDSPPAILNTLLGVYNPVIGMFGETVYAGVFGNSESLYAYPNSYHSAGNSSPRLRRQEMQADKCLNRISVFLLCCFLLCLLLF